MSAPPTASASVKMYTLKIKAAVAVETPSGSLAYSLLFQRSAAATITTTSVEVITAATSLLAMVGTSADITEFLSSANVWHHKINEDENLVKFIP